MAPRRVPPPGRVGPGCYDSPSLFTSTFMRMPQPAFRLLLVAPVVARRRPLRSPAVDGGRPRRRPSAAGNSASGRGASLGVTSPKEQFGFAIGDDYQLATYEQLTAYWRRLDEQSDRMSLVDIGKTAEGRIAVDGDHHLAGEPSQAGAAEDDRPPTRPGRGRDDRGGGAGPRRRGQGRGVDRRRSARQRDARRPAVDRDRLPAGERQR